MFLLIKCVEVAQSLYGQSVTSFCIKKGVFFQEMYANDQYMLLHFFYLCLESVEKTIVFLWHTSTFFSFFICRKSRPFALWILAPCACKTSDEMKPTASKSSLSPGDDFVAGQRRNLDGWSCIVWALTPCEAWVWKLCQCGSGSFITGLRIEQPACVTVLIYTEQLSASGRD